MAVHNAKVANLLRRYASLLSLQPDSRFKVKAYRKAADTIEGLSADIGVLVKRKEDLQQLPGVGKAIARAIEEIVRTDHLPQLDRSLTTLSPESIELSTKPLLNPKDVLRVYKKLDIHTLAELQQRLESGEIRRVLGSRVDFAIRRGLDERPRLLLYDAEPLAKRVEGFLKSIPGVTHVSAAGSLRRKQDTVGDLNFLIAGKKSAAKIFKEFLNFGAVETSEKISANQVRFQLSTRTTIQLVWTPPEQWGLGLLLQTGSTAHVQSLSARAAKKRLSLTVAKLAKKHVDLSEEKPIYAGLGLSYVEPELREDRGEIEAAASRQLPKLIRLQDIRGDLHMHTTSSDGANTLPEMAKAAQARGYEYIAITDHSQSLKITNGLTEKRLFQQLKAIDRLNDRLKYFVVLKSAEVDILEDGRLDYSNAALKELDFTICSIHSRFALNKEQQTTRILRAMDNPCFTILGHATGRLLLKREGYELDVKRVLKHAKANGCFVEINSSPDRLDLSEENAKLAKEMGIKIAINTDAHSIKELGFISAGLHQARRAWLEPTDVLNTLPIGKLKKQFKR
jgi:DNA polymerase (family X)